MTCQDVSHAGRRAGLIRDGEGRTRSGLWGHMLRAITELRPRLVVAENVRGLLSAAADSDMEPCPWCVGGAGSGEPPVRALGAVLADLADVGYDAAWYGLRAADVGAAHGRFRVFIFAWPAADADGWGREGGSQLDRDEAPSATDGDSPRQHTDGHPGAEVLTLLPTPRTSDTNGAGHHGTGGPDLRTVVDLLPTPRATDGTKGGPNQAGSSGDLMLPSAVQPARWGDYAPAIARWESVIGRPAPSPTEPGPKGNPRLSAAFVEWLMGLPVGHVTHTSLTRNEQLKALGNGVVPQQAAASTRAFLEDMARERAA